MEDKETNIKLSQRELEGIIDMIGFYISDWETFGNRLEYEKKLLAKLEYINITNFSEMKSAMEGFFPIGNEVI